MKFLGVYNKEDDSYKKLRQIGYKEYEEYNRSVKRIYEINEALLLLEAVRANYQSYIELMKHYLSLYMSSQNIDVVTMDQMIGNINLHLINYLSTVKTFLEHSEFKLKSLYGANSDRYKNFENTKSNLFDSCFSYRFLYHLRNYVQHCGMPIAGFDGVKYGHNDKINKRIEVFLIAYCDRDELLKKYDSWHRILLKEIPKLQPKIDITPHVSNVMICIKKISRIVIKDDLDELMKNAKFLQKLMYPFISTEPLHELINPSEIDNIPFICESTDLFDDNIFNLEWFPLHMIQVVFYANTNL